MKLKIYKNVTNPREVLDQAEASRSTRPSFRLLQFGSDIIELPTRPESQPAGETAAVRAQTVEVTPFNFDPAWVHLVTQKGRLFNREHPEIPVLYDRGRFQLVAIEPQRAAGLAGSDLCFDISAVNSSIQVFSRAERTQRLPEIPPWERELVDSVNATRFMSSVEELAAFHNRHSLSDHYSGLVTVLKAQMESLGYTSTVVPIRIFNRGTGQPVGDSSNLVTKKVAGHGGDPGLVLVTAHLDSVNLRNQLDPALVAPGADDNGSGSAGVLEIARVFSEHVTRNEIWFVLFGGEEQNLYGSTQFLLNMSEHDRSRLIAVVNMDMIGVLNAQPPTVLIEGAAVSRHVIKGLSLRATAHTRLEIRTSENPFASDHVPFIEAGLPSVLTIEGDDSQNDNIHTPDDVPENVDPLYAREILRMNVGYIASLTES